MQMREMCDSDYIHFIHQSVLRQAEDRAWAKGTISADELKVLLDIVPRLLPDQQNTEGQWMRKAVSEASGEILGFIWAGRYPGLAEGSCVLMDIVVEKAWRGMGVGREILTCMLDWCCSNGTVNVLLNVRSDNIPALRLYESAGFLVTRSCSGAGFLEMGLTMENRGAA